MKILKSLRIDQEWTRCGTIIKTAVLSAYRQNGFYLLGVYSNLHSEEWAGTRVKLSVSEARQLRDHLSRFIELEERP